MSVKEYTKTIIDELMNFAQLQDDTQLNDVVDAIIKSKKIFLSGAGRSRVAIMGFTNRLLHLGFNVHLVGEISCPYANKDDLLIIGSGSGATSTLVSLAQKAKINQVKVALITMDEKSDIALVSDYIVILPGASSKLKSNHLPSIQPMGSAFEQICFLTYDAIILELMDRMSETSQTMMKRHTNLE